MENNKIEYRYEFADGNVVMVGEMDGLTEKWVSILKELDRITYNNEHKETRRHCSLEAYGNDDAFFADPRDVFEAVELEMSWTNISKNLTERETLIVTMYYRTGYTQKEIAVEFGITEARVSMILRSVRKKLKKVLKTVKF